MPDNFDFDASVSNDPTQEELLRLQTQREEFLRHRLEHLPRRSPRKTHDFGLELAHEARWSHER